MSSKPDNLEKSLRFGCGGIFGVAIGMLIWAKVFPQILSVHTVVMCLVMLVAINGYLAVRFGDRFWETVSDWFSVVVHLLRILFT